MAYIQNQYYLKDKKAMIYWEKPSTKDSDGFPISGGHVPFSKVPMWCYTKQLSQDQVFSAMAYGVNENRFFVFNNTKNVSVYNLILYKDKWYEITRVDTMDDYNGDLFIYVKDCPRGGKPNADDLLPYEPYSEPTE